MRMHVEGAKRLMQAACKAFLTAPVCGCFPANHGAKPAPTPPYSLARSGSHPPSVTLTLSCPRVTL